MQMGSLICCWSIVCHPPLFFFPKIPFPFSSIHNHDELDMVQACQSSAAKAPFRVSPCAICHVLFPVPPATPLRHEVDTVRWLRVRKLARDGAYCSNNLVVFRLPHEKREKRQKQRNDPICSESPDPAEYQEKKHVLSNLSGPTIPRHVSLWCFNTSKPRSGHISLHLSLHLGHPTHQSRSHHILIQFTVRDVSCFGLLSFSFLLAHIRNTTEETSAAS